MNNYTYFFISSIMHYLMLFVYSFCSNELKVIENPGPS